MTLTLMLTHKIWYAIKQINPKLAYLMQENNRFSYPL